MDKKTKRLFSELTKNLSPDDVRIFETEICQFCSDVVNGYQLSDLAHRLDLYGRERLWLYKLAERLTDKDKVQRSPEQRQIEISYRAIDLAYSLGLSRDYDLNESLQEPSGTPSETSSIS